MTPEQRREQAEKPRHSLNDEGPIKKDSLVRNVQLAIRISLAADGLAEALRKLIHVGDRNTDDWNNARKALDTYERAKKE